MCKMIRYATQTTNLLLKIKGALQSFFVLVRHYRQHIFIALEVGRRLGTNRCESDDLAVKLLEMIFNGLLNISTAWYSARIRDRTLDATDH